MKDRYDTGFRSGFCAVVGRPNVGKSTLLNRVIGQKVTIVSDKPQTTRNKIRCIWTTEHAQIVFIDTPGFHRPKHRLGERMVQAANDALHGVDTVLFVVDAPAGPGRGDMEVAKRLKDMDCPVALVLNKIDLLTAEERIEAEETFSKLGQFDIVQSVCALNGDGVQDLMDWLINQMDEGPKYYPDDWLSDHPERFIAGELIREQLLHVTREEIPHAIAIDVEKMEARDSQHMIDLSATIYVERESQKGIVIGKRGSRLKEVGTLARSEIEKLLGSPINLQLWVKVNRDWREKERALAALGYER